MMLKNLKDHFEKMWGQFSIFEKMNVGSICNFLKFYRGQFNFFFEFYGMKEIETTSF
jgi:hypothetical protein